MHERNPMNNFMITRNGFILDLRSLFMRWWLDCLFLNPVLFSFLPSLISVHQKGMGCIKL
jgi:hypothetical protein